MKLDADILSAAIGCQRSRAAMFSGALDVACARYAIDTLSDVSPRQPDFDTPNLCLRDTNLNGDVALLHATGKHAPDLMDIHLRQLRSSYFSSARETFRLEDGAILSSTRSRRLNHIKDAQRVSHVLGVSDVLQVFEPIVPLLSVFMIDGHAVRSRADEGFAHQLVHKEGSTFAVSGKAHVQVAVMVGGSLERALARVIAVATAHVSYIGDFVHAFIAAHREPLNNRFHGRLLYLNQSLFGALR